MGNLSFGVTRLGAGISCLLELSLSAERLSSVSGVHGDAHTRLLRLTTRKPCSLQPRGAVSVTPTPHTAPGHAAWLLQACSAHCLWAPTAVGVPHGHRVPSRRLAPSELREHVGSTRVSLSQARPEPSGKSAHRPFRGTRLGFPQNCVVSPVLRRTQMLTQPRVGPTSPRAAQQLRSDRRSPAERHSQHTRILGRAPQSPGHLHNATQTSSQQPLLLFIWPCKWRVQGSTGVTHITVFMESGCKQDPR